MEHNGTNIFLRRHVLCWCVGVPCGCPERSRQPSAVRYRDANEDKVGKRGGGWDKQCASLAVLLPYTNCTPNKTDNTI